MIPFPFLILCLAGFLASLAFASAEPARRPNIIVILTDDQGYADLACQGQLDDLRTPHLDRLAADGLRCTSGYVSAPQCIPSRAGLLAGRDQGRFGVDHNATIPMPLDEVLIPHRLQRAGYRTGMVGKWHLEPSHQHPAWVRQHLPGAKPGKNGIVHIPGNLRRPYLPDARGFDDVFCGNNNSYWANFTRDGKDLKPARDIKEPGYRLDLQTEAALAFIDRRAKDPFLLYLAYFAPHVPLEATENYLSRFPGEMPRRRRLALAMIAAMDDGVGRIREKLGQHGLTRDTLIFFISDNGAPLAIDMKDEPESGPEWDGSRNDPWVGEKGMLTEGGIRVPFLVTWPGTLPSGKTYNHPVSSLDVGATALAVAGLEQPTGLDGKNLLPHLSGKTDKPPHEALYWRFWNQAAVRQGKWKFYQAGDRKFLFDLESPEHETLNRLARHPEIALDLEAKLKSWADQLKNPGLTKVPPNRQEKAWFQHYLPRN
jgi:arylsulfatase A-like enzyme